MDPISSIAVTAPAGPIRGELRGGTAVFRGIPFAEAPLGEARFRAPRRRARFAEERDATRWGPTPQKVPLFNDTVIPEPSVPGEDVLNLNVFARADSLGSGSLPVLVWIHGGGYQAGSAIGSWFDGESFVRDGVVVVSISYRLGIEGFGLLADGDSNVGMRDWICALEWVQENIAAFGGDPAAVTVAGQSAGGGAVYALLASPRADGLFARAWALSGVVADAGLEDIRSFTGRFAASLGLAPTVAALGSLDSTQLQQALLDYRPEDEELMHRSSRPLMPARDELLPEPIVTGIARPGAGVPLLFGCTADEFSPSPALAQLGDPAVLRRTLEGWGIPVQEVGAYLASRELPPDPGVLSTDLLFRSAGTAVARARAGVAAPSWGYDLRWRSTTTGVAGHCYDIPFFFDLLGAEGVERWLGSPPAGLAEAMHDRAVSFIRDGDPGFPPVASEQGPLQVFDDPLRISEEGFGPAALLSRAWLP